MFKRTVISSLLIGCVIVACTIFGTETKNVPASLDEATTFEEIQAYIQHAFAESQKNRRTLEEEKRFSETIATVGLTGGRKIIALGGSDESLEYGYGILLTALNSSSRLNPENMPEEFETIIEELKKTGKFPDLVFQARFLSFIHQCRLFENKIPTNEFSAIKDEFDSMKKWVKELAALDTRGFARQEAMQIVLNLAQKISVANEMPHFLEEVLEELVSFIMTSDRFVNKTANVSMLRGHARRMVGSPFELWGKTVDGNDFNWADYKDKIVLVKFTAHWCGPCRVEIPNIREMYDKYHGNGLEIVYVGVRDTTDNLKKMIAENKLPYTVICEELSKEHSRGLPSDHYGVYSIPGILLVGKDGRIIATGLRGPTLRDSVERQFAER